MGLFGPDAGREREYGGSAGQAEKLHRGAERRRKKLEKQERRVKRLSSPLSVWIVKAFAPLAVICTAGMAAAEFASCRDAEAYYGFADYAGRMTATAFAMWTIFGGVWIFAAAAVLHSIKTGRAEDDVAAKAGRYRRGQLIALAVWIALAALFAAFLAI
jgi:hypothetical protein